MLKKSEINKAIEISKVGDKLAKIDAKIEILEEILEENLPQETIEKIESKIKILENDRVDTRERLFLDRATAINEKYGTDGFLWPSVEEVSEYFVLDTIAFGPSQAAIEFYKQGGEIKI